MSRTFVTKHVCELFIIVIKKDNQTGTLYHTVATVWNFSNTIAEPPPPQKKSMLLVNGNSYVRSELDSFVNVEGKQKTLYKNRWFERNR